MGNKLCKKRVDATDCQNSAAGTAGKTPRSLNKIMHRLNLRPKWRSDSNLEDKHTTINSEAIATIPVADAKPVSKSTDWIDCAREPNVKKSIFNDDTTPTPPPRKCIPVRKSLLASVKEAFKNQATTTNNNNNDDDEQEIEEEVMVKTTINYNCPCGGNHARCQHDDALRKLSGKRHSRDMNASNNSLPNYSDTRFSLPTPAITDSDLHTSIHSLQDEHAKKAYRRSISNDLDAYLTRAKSIGSLIPSVLQRLSTTKAPLAEIESDDSLNSLDDDGSMDDWGAGLNMIEHYQPRESSLPRPSRRTDAEIIADLEGMIVDEIIEEPPVPPARRSETLLKKIHRDVKSTNCTPPPTPEESLHLANQQYNEDNFDAQKDHSPLMKILKECKDHDEVVLNTNDVNLLKNNFSPVHTYKSEPTNKGDIDEFLAAERAHDELFKKQIIS